MRSYRKRILVLLMIVSTSAIIVILFNVFNSGLQVGQWKDFKKATLRKYTFIKDVEIYGNSPSLFISYNLSKKVNLLDIERVFEETRSFLFNKRVFEDLLRAHDKKYGGTMVRIYVDFTRKDNKIDYEFSSDCQKDGIPDYESFDKWFIECNGEIREYMPITTKEDGRLIQ